uniref:Dicer n=1 Tax=Schistosoma mansoni TaxID=6183 RepID=B0EVY6_SCHMA|nr:dicer [Schistosoma mansoni]
MVVCRDVKYQIAKKILKNVPNDHFLPPPYQLDLLDAAYERNTIICSSNELNKMFFVVNLIREMRFDNPGKQIIYFTDDTKMNSIDNFLTHHTGLSCYSFKYDEQNNIKKDFMDRLTSVVRKYDIILLSPWLIPVIVMLSSVNFFTKLIHQYFYLVVVDECHMVLDSNHPLSIVFGPNGPMLQNTEDFGPTATRQNMSDFNVSVTGKVRILCFTSALLPREITDPEKARLRLQTLEKRTSCRLETASELLTMLSLGARPQERVILCSKSSSIAAIPFHQFMLGVFREIKEFIIDIESNLPCTKSSSIGDSTSVVINSGGFRICVLDYCKRAISQCEEILNELGLWCAAQIVRVFAKHLIALDRQRSEILKNCELVNNDEKEKGEKEPNSSTSCKSSYKADILKDNEYSITIPKINDNEDRISYLLRLTVTQMCFLSRLFQMEFDSILTLEEFQRMISPKVLNLIEQLKLYKPSMNFRIEVAELPTAKNPPIITTNNKKYRKGGSRQRNSRCQTSKISNSSLSSMGFISCDVDSLSDSMSDTMSSLSDDDDDTRSVRSLNSTKSRLSTQSMKNLNSSSKSRKRKNRSNSLINSFNLHDLHFVPASTLNNGGIRPDVDPSTLVYRAVLNTDNRHNKNHNRSGFIGQESSDMTASTNNNNDVSFNRLCGLILVPCQFSAYALSRLIDELCIWDVDLYFIKIGHLFCRQTLLKEDNDLSTTTNQTLNKTKHGTNFNPYKTLVKFSNEPVNNNDSSTNNNSNCRNPFSVNQEETITNFRRGAINLLVATQAAISTVTTSGTELPRCNLVIALRLPNSLAEYLSSKARSRLVNYGAKVIYLMDHDSIEKINNNNNNNVNKQSNLNDKQNRSKQTDDHSTVDSMYSNHINDQFLGNFQQLEQLLLQRCRGYNVFADEHAIDPTVVDKILPPIFPRGPCGPKFCLSKAINIINQYCARLPSDYITNLTPKWYWKIFPQPQGFTPSSTGPGSTCGSLKDLQPDGTFNLYQCVLRLPINSSVKETIVGEPMVCKKLAKYSAAFNAIHLLYLSGEMDSKWELINRETNPMHHLTSENYGNLKLSSQHSPMKYKSFSSLNGSANIDSESDYGDYASSIGCCESADDEGEMKSNIQNTVKRRQYYYRKFPTQMSNCLPQPNEPSSNYLYYIDMHLVKPFAEQQYLRGRVCHHPENEPIGFGLLTTKPLHHIPIFPIFSRSGEEKIRFIELWSPKSNYQFNDQYLPIQGPILTQEQIDRLIKFHRILFQEVLRFEKDSVLEFNFHKAYLQVLVVPARRDTCSIDWDFINLVLTSSCDKSICHLLPRRMNEISQEEWKERIDQIKLQAGVVTSNGSGKTFNTSNTHHHHNRKVGGDSVASILVNRLQKSGIIESNSVNNKPSIFEFRMEEFVNAVVTPGYRNLDQPQYYYVAIIRNDMSPLSPFPSDKFRNFAAYYINKYNALITTNNQPLLDVDLTVLRLNLLIPRYMNIYGHNNTNANDNNGDINNSKSNNVYTHKQYYQQQNHDDHQGEDLTNKQLLVPELCFRHSFPASVWRKAVCIPSILYRLEHLLLAEELRHRIACETNLGCAYLPECNKILKDDFVNLSSHYNKNGDVNDPDTTSCLFESLNIHLPIAPDHVVVNNESTSKSNTYNNNNNERKPTTTNSKFLGSSGGKSRGGGRRKQNCRNTKRAKNHNVIGTTTKVKLTENVPSDQSDTCELNKKMSTIELNENNKKDSSYYSVSNSHTSTDQINKEQNNVSISSDNDNIYDDEDHRNSIDAETKENHDSSNDNLVVVNEDDGDDDLLSEKPTILKLHATSASMVHNNKHHRHQSSAQKSTTTALSSLPYDHFSLSNGNLESLLQETKVIELNSNDANPSNNSEDEDELRVVENYINMDKEYLVTDSDTESVDSFEGNVHFFPPEDDNDYDNDLSEFNISRQLDSEKPSNNIRKRAYQPGPTTILQALTMSCSNDFINLERMETIGDSFLKFVVTVHLYLTYPEAHEGKLSHLRSRIVCNSNLYRLGKAKDLQNRMIGCKFEPHENWIPPGYYVRQDKRLNNEIIKKFESNRNLVIWSTDTLMDDEVLRNIDFIDENKIKPIENFPISEWDPNDPKVLHAQHLNNQYLITIQQAIPDKSIADCVEALIGCYLTTRGERSALRLMQWFGIDCLHKSDNSQPTARAPWSLPKSNYLDTDENRANLNEARLVWRFDELESSLNYTFKDPSLLIQAFTHPSYHQLRVLSTSNNLSDQSNLMFSTDLDCYQRLEFLGDAVLDYVITRFLYEDSKQHSPGVLTDLRSALVNNNIFAALAVRIGLHKYFRASSPQLLHTIDVFVRYQKDVAKDDLDFITNEEIEIRQPELVDTFTEETINNLTSSNLSSSNSYPVTKTSMMVNNQNTPSIISISKQRHCQTHVHGDVSEEEGGVKEKDNDNDDEEDDLYNDDEEEKHASILNHAKECESKWQEKDTQELTGLFVQNSSENQSSKPQHQTYEQHLSKSGKSNNANNTIPTNTGHLTTNRLSDDVEIPKALSDIFESLAGAIFLDSNFSLDTVWQIFYPIMKERIERYTACIPKSPVRQLLELEPEGTKFERARRMVDGRISVCAHVLGKGRFYGVGRNYRLAKSLAAKRALRVLRRLNQPSQTTPVTTNGDYDQQS